jgi:O-acetyl-ADP-ribose deacetylase (regulator of RNase III)
MNLQHKKGNLLTLAQEGEFDIIVHGCNCFCKMGSGIAKEIRTKYPLAASADGVTKSGDYLKLGNWTEYKVLDKFTIINAYTQYNVSSTEDVFEYVAFSIILQKLLQKYGSKRIGFPYIGMGLAGGDKNIILPMLEDFATEVRGAGGIVTLVEFTV